LVGIHGVLLLTLAFPVGAADEPIEPFSRAATEENLARTKEVQGQFQNLLQKEVERPELAAMQSQVGDLRKWARDCIDSKSADLVRLTGDLKKLGEPVDAEDAAVKDARRRLGEEKAALDQGIASCRLLLVDSENLLDAIANELTNLKARELFARFPGALNVFGATAGELAAVRTLVRHHSESPAYPLLDAQWHSGLVVLVIVALILAPLVSLSFKLPSAQPPAPEEFIRGLYFAFFRAMRRYGGWLTVLGLLAVYWGAVSWRLGTLVAEMGMTLSVLTLLVVLLLGRTFLAPLAPAPHYLPFDAQISRRFWRAVRFLAGVWATAAFLYFDTYIEWPVTVALHVRFAYMVLFAVALARVVWVFFELRPRAGFGIVRFIVLLVLAAGVIAEFIGYRNFSGFLIQGVLLTLLALSLAWLLSRMSGDLLDSLEEGRYPWQQRLHRWLGIAEGHLLPGVFWMRLLTGLGVWLAAIWSLVRVWNVPESIRADAVAYVTEGFQVGEITIVPSRILIAVGLLAVLFSAISWLRKRLDESWLSKSRADVGARNAVSTVAAYIGATLAILLGLSVAGMDLSNLAIIAGALSVGIGFGLQNIVNNFVSGLILLFERPIKKGDWIIVGTTEGYVKKISVRSTQIQTFDNADVIVPNSELISQQVTNWMLYDRQGRVRVPVGVAYGTDVQKVKEILLGIVMAHPQTVVSSRLSKPMVLFLGFGDSALNFEARFFIRNVDNRLSVLSDVNFAIEEAFRENDIAVPFPQTDVHLHYPPPFERKDTALSGEEVAQLDGPDTATENGAEGTT